MTTHVVSTALVVACLALFVSSCAPATRSETLDGVAAVEVEEWAVADAWRDRSHAPDRAAETARTPDT